MLIGSVDVLQPLYDFVVVPQMVAGELEHTAAPDFVRTWIAQPPDWCEIRPDMPSDASLKFLDPGERAAISLALFLDANRLLIDEWEGRAEAERRHLRVTGTLGVLAEAHRHHLLDFEAAVARLGQTSFYMSEKLLNQVRQQLSIGRRSL